MNVYEIPRIFWVTLLCSLWSQLGWGQEAVIRTIPSRIVPVPNTVSPTLQKWIAQARLPDYKFPKTPEEWSALEGKDENPSDFPREFAEIQDRFKVAVVPEIVGGVHCYVVTPKIVDPANRSRLLLALHLGGWVFAAGEAGTLEAVMMASFTRTKVVEVDYRMLPSHPFPAAMDDVMAVYRELLRNTPPRNIGVFGSSVGGSMALSLVQRAKIEGLPLPGAVMSGSPFADISKSGDTYFTNDGVDTTITYGEFWSAVEKLYANGRDLKDPSVSPVYGDFHGFPPTFLISGTRDLFLSNTVRVQRKLLEAGVSTQLEVGEAQSHTDYFVAALMGAPEGAEIYSDAARFFDVHLGN